MRPFTTLTAIASMLLATPSFFWLTGLSPGMLFFLHLVAFSLVARLLYLCAQAAVNAADVIWVGVYAGAIGGLVNQLILHTALAGTRLAATFTIYGSLAPILWRLDEGSLWWPLGMALGDAVLYGLVALGMHRWTVTRRQHWAQWDG